MKRIWPYAPSAGIAWLSDTWLETCTALCATVLWSQKSRKFPGKHTVHKRTAHTLIQHTPRTQLAHSTHTHTHTHTPFSLQNPHIAEPKHVSFWRKKTLVKEMEDATRNYNLLRLNRIVNDFRTAIPPADMVSAGVTMATVEVGHA